MTIPNDPALWAGRDAVMATWEEAGYRRFALRGRSDIVSAQVSPEGELELFPERSGAHRALALALGARA